MANFFDISTWNEKPWYQTGGTRDKVIVENPANGLQYYFKTSLKKIEIDYKHEFWSEIIASEIGVSLGFNTLKYDIAFKKTEMGCLSESMIQEDKNNLNELVRYLTGCDTSYKPEERYSKTQYTFQFIRDALNYFELEVFIDDIIRVIVFDSIIGNGDRHQENWGIITNYEDVIPFLINTLKNEKGFMNKILLKVLSQKQIIESNSFLKRLLNKNMNLFIPGEFSPIYDSGSSLGRELADTKIELMLKNDQMITAYINRGDSEIHWEGKKLNHFDLIQKISTEYKQVVEDIIMNVKNNFDPVKIRDIVESIDKEVPENFSSFKLPHIRKEFIIKLITLRFQKLVTITP